MKNGEINLKLGAVVEIINYCQKNDIRSIYLNRRLLLNYETLKKAADRIQAQVPKELVALENKIRELGKAEWLRQKQTPGTPGMHVVKEGEEIQVTDEKEPNLFHLGMRVADPEDVKRQKELFDDFKPFYEEETQIKLNFLEEKKIQDLRFDYDHTVLLENFMKK